MKYKPDDIKRKALKDKVTGTEQIHTDKPLRQRKNGMNRMIQNMEDAVDSERTYSDKPKADRFKHIRKFLKRN